MRIIGHRGAASLALENSLASIAAAKQAGVDAIELDIRLTADLQFVLAHDQTTGRIAETPLSVRRHSLRDLQAIKLTNGEVIPTLDQAIDAAGTTPLVIEAKGAYWADKLATFLSSRHVPDSCVISFNHAEIVRFHELVPTFPCYILERGKPFEALRFARNHKLTGVDLKVWLVNPLTYWYAHHAGLKLITYTVNQPWQAWFLKLFYPRLSITTDVPQHMQRLRDK